MKTCWFSSAFDCNNVIIPDQISLSNLQNCYKTSEHSPVLSLSAFYLVNAIFHYLPDFPRLGYMLQKLD